MTKQEAQRRDEELARLLSSQRSERHGFAQRRGLSSGDAVGDGVGGGDGEAEAKQLLRRRVALGSEAADGAVVSGQSMAPNPLLRGGGIFDRYRVAGGLLRTSARRAVAADADLHRAAVPQTAPAACAVRTWSSAPVRRQPRRRLDPKHRGRRADAHLEARGAQELSRRHAAPTRWPQCAMSEGVRVRRTVIKMLHMPLRFY